MKKKISDKVREQILTLSETMKPKEVAEKLGIDTGTVSYIKWSSKKEVAPKKAKKKKAAAVVEKEEEIEEEKGETDWESWAQFYKDKYLEAHAALIELERE